MRANYRDFDGLAIPRYNRTATLLTAQSGSGLVPVIGGAVDRGGHVMKTTPTGIELTATIYHADEATVWQEAQAWVAKVGTRGELTRKVAGAITQRIRARLVEASAEGGYETPRKVQPMRLRFAFLESSWRGRESKNWTLNSGHLLNDGELLNGERTYSVTGSAPIAIPYAGTVPEEAISLIISSTQAIPTGMRIVFSSGCDLILYRTLAAGAALEIDGARKTIRVGMTGCYKQLAFGSGHRQSAWLRLEPGENQVTITAAVPVTVRIEYAERYG